jgi:hypothetical protein
MKVEGSKSDVGVLFLLLGLSLAGNVYQFRRTFGGAPAPTHLLAPGDVVAPVALTTLDGRSETLSYGNGPTVLYVFSPTCPWCLRNIPNLKRLVEGAGRQYRFVGLSLDEKGVSAYVAEHQLPLAVYTKGPDDVAGRSRLGGVPQTMVISAEGRVVQNWSGAYVGDTQKAIEKFFEVKLPGLAEPSAPPHVAAQAQGAFGRS